jgi:hypothetical protein
VELWAQVLTDLKQEGFWDGLEEGKGSQSIDELEWESFDVGGG